jgi:hypothetical protein
VQSALRSCGFPGQENHSCDISTQKTQSCDFLIRDNTARDKLWQTPSKKSHEYSPMQKKCSYQMLKNKEFTQVQSTRTIFQLGRVYLMLDQMNCQTPFLSKSMPTDRTFIWLLPCVSPHMKSQMILAEKLFFTIRTFQSLWWMIFHVTSETIQPLEGLWAKFTHIGSINVIHVFC